MKSSIKLIGIIALVVVMGFSMASCGDDGGGGGGGGGGGDGTTLSGTYTFGSGTDYTITFYSNNSFSGYYGGSPLSGTYLVTGSTLTLTVPGQGVEIWTIVNSTTLRDSDGDLWIKSGGSPNPPNPPNNGGGGADTGLYMGIIGFNTRIYTKDISLLNSSTKSQFQTFVNGLSMDDDTGLYYAVENAISKLQAANLPSDLDNVSIVTFTDGLDNHSTMLNTSHSSPEAYRQSLRNSISNTKIKGLNINAYCIGIRGGDVRDLDAFRTGLQAIASGADKVFEVTSMDQVNSTFETIARGLTTVTSSQSIKLRSPGGYADGTKIRFTFDNITEAEDSTLYIEGIFRVVSGTTGRYLENIVYQGLTSSSGSRVNAEIIELRPYFTFEDIKTPSGSLNTQGTQQWFTNSNDTWGPNTEFRPGSDMETTTTQKSAVIMLVLDATTSLNAGGANGFTQMKTHANNFIDIMVSGSGNTGGNTGGGGSGTQANPIVLTANAWANGNIPTSSGEQWFKFTATASTQYIHFSFGTLNDLYFQAYNSSFTAIGSRLNMYSPSYNRVNLTNYTVGQVYYFKITPYSSSYSGTYRVAFNASTTAPQ